MSDVSLPRELPTTETPFTVKYYQEKHAKSARKKTRKLSIAGSTGGWGRSANTQIEMDCKKNSNHKMESWLLDVKRMKIPRPKFSGKYPMEPPKDYSSEDLTKDEKRTAAAFLTARNIVKATEDLRRELQDKL